MAITITENAASHIRQSLTKHGSGIGLRLSIKLSGCSGYAYQMDIAEDVSEDDEVFEEHGSKVVIDKKSLKLVDGTTVDFKKDGLNKVLTFDNPRADAVCGCGESFTLTDDA